MCLSHSCLSLLETLSPNPNPILPLYSPQTTLLRGSTKMVSEKCENLKNTFVWSKGRSGGLSGKKESGQLHFRGKEKPFCAPLLGRSSSYLWFELECPLTLKVIDNDRVLVLDEEILLQLIIFPT
ncbi:hypothetical protein GmHk_11G032089 [Glycine max]|nr:hypothetical protein GmHk_11G032089 [Glycine max]